MEGDQESHRLLKNINSGITLLVVLLLIAAGVFIFWRWDESNKRNAERDVQRFSECIDERIAAGRPTDDCHTGR